MPTEPATMPIHAKRRSRLFTLLRLRRRGSLGRGACTKGAAD
jgi:hypothetical protein